MLRSAIRSLRRTPAFTVATVATIALGIGPAAALFSVVKAVLLNPLPYPNPRELVWAASLGSDGTEARTAMPNYDDWRSRSTMFGKLAAYTDAPLLTAGGEFPERTPSAIVTEDFFDALGVQPRLGRTFLPFEHEKGAPFGTVVIGDGLWRRAYGADPGIVGRKITVFGFQATVAGVMPPEFSYPEGTELWASARALGEGMVRSAPNYWVIGRLRQGVTPEAASSEIAGIARQLKVEFPHALQPPSAHVVPLSGHITGNVRVPILILFGAVGLLLLIVCVNVANFLLARGAARRRELAVCAALGASHRTLFLMLLVESLILSISGGVLGLVIAGWCMDLLRTALPAGIPRAQTIEIDAGVIGFAVAASILTGILFGVLPARRAARSDPHESLSLRGRGHTAGRRSQRMQNALAILQISLSMVLLAGAGLLIESFARLRAVDPGFRPSGVLAMSLSFPMNRAEAGRIGGRYDELLSRIRTVPGVDSAGVVLDIPLATLQRTAHFRIENREESGGVRLRAGYRVVSAGLLETLQIQLDQGRHFNTAESQPAVIVSAAMARKFWPGRSPIGERIWFDDFDPKPNWLTVTGVARDARHVSLIEPPEPQAYVLYSHMQVKGYLSNANILVRTQGDSAGLTQLLRRLVQGVHPEAAATFRTLDEVLDGALSRHRFQMQVLGGFASLAVVLSAIGLYGMLAYLVSSNRAAIGIRMALGATRREVFGMVTKRAMALTLSGALIGLSGCLALRGAFQSVVYGIGPSDPRVLSIAAITMIGIAMAASWIPASRAMSVDPILVLREE